MPLPEQNSDLILIPHHFHYYTKTALVEISKYHSSLLYISILKGPVRGIVTSTGSSGRLQPK